MAESQNNKTTYEIEIIIKDVQGDKIIINIDYELMTEKLRRFNDINEELTSVLLSTSKQNTNIYFLFDFDLTLNS